MHARFNPKHQKLILQCYPAGRTTDKRPNPSELSYLLYYVSTRRAKLTKVGLFLEQKAQSDVYRAKAGFVLSLPWSYLILPRIFKTNLISDSLAMSRLLWIS